MRNALGLLLVAACGGGDTQPGDSGTGTPDAGCVRDPAPADRVRRVVVSHPYDAAGMPADVWEVLDLSPTGEPSRPGRTFTMGRATVGEVAFTRDGEIGVTAQDDGTVGVFKLDAAGVPTVIHAGLAGAFYAARVVTSPTGTIYVLDDQWRENGGGIYELAIDCDDNVSERALVTAAKLPAAVAWLPGTQQAIVAAKDIATSPAARDAHLVTWGAPPTVLASADAFPDEDAIVGGAALASDGSVFFIGDTSSFASVPNRIAVVPVNGDALGTATVIPMVEDPMALVAAPDAATLLVVSGFGDAMFAVKRDPDGVWRDKGEVAYLGAPPQLPSGAVKIEAGALRGLALVAENLGVRRVLLGANGDVTDQGLFSLGSGYVNTVGAIGVTP